MKTLVICIAIISTVLINSTFSQKFDRSQKPSTLNKADRFSHYSKFNINNISTFIYNNGNADLMPTGNSGFEFPKGSNKYAVFESGLLWGGIINNKIHVGGSTYSQGLLGGKILEDGTPQNPEDESARVYRVRPDFLNSDLYAEINGSEGTISEIRKQYETDWNEWPANDGAPFNDLDNDGIYNPQIDIPGVPGADQTLWYVANDFDDETVFNMYGSEPMKLEVQVTVWGYKHYDIYDNVLFKKYKVINKNSENIDSMYFTIWSDPDLGDAGDDLVGCDTLLNLGYSYNGDDDDAVYRSEIPAVGFQILQGPIVNGTSDEFAIKDNQKVYGKKNVGMTSFFFFIGGDDVYNDPDLGDYQYGTLGFYNIMRGRIPHTGSPFIDPRTNETTMFVLSGDPITKEGWIDGVQYWPGDRRMAMTSGPFELKADSTQEIIFAELAAVDKDRLSSVVLLKDFAKDFQNNFPLEVEEPETPNINNLIPELVYKNLGVYNQIELEIVGSKEITNFSEMGYKFQGYNIYQLPGDYDYSKNSIKIKTFDIIDDVTQIMGEVLDPATGEITYGIYQNGTDSGIPKKVSIEKDYFDNSPLLKGKKYFYGISAYFNNINPKAEIKAIESRLSFVTATFKMV